MIFTSANKNGGKWMVRLKKGLASLLWEEIILSVIGEQVHHLSINQ
jgi:translation initiation factor 4E